MLSKPYAHAASSTPKRMHVRFAVVRCSAVASMRATPGETLSREARLRCDAVLKRRALSSGSIVAVAAAVNCIYERKRMSEGRKEIGEKKVDGSGGGGGSRRPRVPAR